MRQAGVTLTALTRNGAPVFAAAIVAVLSLLDSPSRAASDVPPPTLRDTGLYADIATFVVDPRHLAFSPQYPLWTDGASKRRWMSLPPGTAIDASDPDAWVFPVGTRVWKEFSFAGVRVETRYLEHRPDGQWLYAAYAWRPDGANADLVSERGKRNAHPLSGGRSHTIPAISDCKVCHEGGGSRVLGFGALQLSSARDPAAPHAEALPAGGIDLAELVKRGLVVGLPEKFVQTPPRIAAGSATARAALGYLHGNCGHCHNDRGPLRNVGLFLRHLVGADAPPAIATTFGRPITERAPGQSADAVKRIDRDHPERSALAQRIASRYPPLQMPPLGTELVDHDAVALVRRWLSEVTNPPPKNDKGS
jgi:hypothetical protein